jgi:hypothetical protein
MITSRRRNWACSLRVLGVITVCGVTASLASATPSYAQQAAADACFKFDRSYFHWVGRPPGGGPVLIDSSAVVRLLTTEAEHGRDRYAILPPSMSVDSFATRRWTQSSGWRRLAADSIEVSWYNGLYGPLLRVAQYGDSLRGHVRFRTDVIGAERPSEPASAVRIECPRD